MIVERLQKLFLLAGRWLWRRAWPSLKSANQLVLIGVGLILTGLIIAGTSLLSVYLAERASAHIPHTTHALHNNQVKANAAPLISGQPTHISIPSVGIDLPVIPGYYNPSDQSWTLTDSNAQYATVTAKANNQQGDTFIYGHALTNVFGSLPKIQPGGQAVITTDNHHQFIYTFTSSVITTPQDTSLFDYKGQPILVLQTCTGLWWQDRQLFTFKLTSVT